MRVVFDTNIIVSGLNFLGNEYKALNLASQGRFELFLSPYILEELEGVLDRKFNWHPADSLRTIDRLRNSYNIIEPQLLPEVIRGGHPDNRILECAIEADADYLVTGDKRHLLPLEGQYEIRIVTTSQFLSILDIE